MPDYSKDIISLVRQEKQDYEDGSQEIRNKIKASRRNYASVFVQPYTRDGRRKKFIPVTRWEVDTVASKYFVNERAVSALPGNEKSVFSSFIGDQVLKYQMRHSRFSTSFRNSMFDLGRDGTIVYAAFWNFKREMEKEQPKSMLEKAKDFFKQNKIKEPKVKVLKDTIGFHQIDLLDCFIDPAADSIQDAPSFIIKKTFTLNQVRANKLYKNTEDLKGFTSLRTDTWDATSTRKYDVGKEDQRYQMPMVNVYERWGDFPMSWLTGKKKDAEKMIRNGVIEVADLFEGKPTVLRIDVNPYHHNLKPFEECWVQKVKGRWYGIGIAEKVLDLQSSVNKHYNRKEENEDMLHAGMFVVKRGSGINARNIRSKPGSIIEADNVDDIRQLDIRDVSQLSQTSIDFILQMIERINGANAVAVGSAADRSATTSIIRDRNADSRFAVIRGNLNDFLTRYFSQWLQLDRQFLTKEFVIRVTQEDIDFELIDRINPSLPNQVDLIPESINKFRFINVSPEDINGEFEVYADIDQSQPQNKAEVAQRILQGIQVGLQLGIKRDYDALYDAYWDNLGLTGLRFKTRMKELPLPPGTEQQLAQEQQAQVAPNVEQFTQANQVAEQSGSRLPNSITGQF